MDGANDTARNETKNCTETLKRTLPELTCTNVVALNIPIRHDLEKESIVNKEIMKGNANIGTPKSGLNLQVIVHSFCSENQLVHTVDP
jgi:hypothetical protein